MNAATTGGDTQPLMAPGSPTRRGFSKFASPIWGNGIFLGLASQRCAAGRGDPHSRRCVFHGFLDGHLRPGVRRHELGLLETRGEEG